MISIEEALGIIRDNIPTPHVQEFALEDAIGLYLAEDVKAPESSPRYTNSAMDGYAVRWNDVYRAQPESPVCLKVVGESQAGMPFNGVVQKDEAIRISTGAMLAAGCDTVVRVEDTQEKDGVVTIVAVKQQGQDLRHKGEEFKTGDLLLKKMARVSAPQAALLESVGITMIMAFKPCQVAVLVTGSELVGSGETIADHQIRDSNMIMLRTAICETGGEVTHSIRISDDKKSTISAIADTTADIILCTGGVSVGRHDHVKDAAEANGFVPLFWRIKQKPGKPLYFARNGKKLLFGLPGNPVSAFMCFSHYVRPVISALNGLSFGWPTVSGKAKCDITNQGSRTNMIRVQLEWCPNRGYTITDARKQGSHMLTSLSEADGYIILEPGRTLKASESIDVYRYDFHRKPV